MAAASRVSAVAFCIARTARGLQFLALGVALSAFGSVARGIEQAQLREVAQRALEGDEVLISEPVIRVENGQLGYYLGGAQIDLEVNPDSDPTAPANLMQIPLDNQLRVEVIRKYRFQRNADFWRRVFKQVEGVIAQQIAVVENTQQPNEARLDKLREMSDSIWEIYQREMDVLARQRNLVATALAAGAGGPSVTLVTEPEGGDIFLVHAVEARLAKLANRPPKWQKVTDPNAVQVGGKYWYSLRWGDRTAGPRLINFDHEGSYTLK